MKKIQARRIKTAQPPEEAAPDLGGEGGDLDLGGGELDLGGLGGGGLDLGGGGEEPPAESEAPSEEGSEVENIMSKLEEKLLKRVMNRILEALATDEAKNQFSDALFSVDRINDSLVVSSENVLKQLRPYRSVFKYIKRDGIRPTLENLKPQHLKRFASLINKLDSYFGAKHMDIKTAAKNLNNLSAKLKRIAAYQDYDPIPEDALSDRQKLKLDNVWTLITHRFRSGEGPDYVVLKGPPAGKETVWLENLDNLGTEQQLHPALFHGRAAPGAQFKSDVKPVGLHDVKDESGKTKQIGINFSEQAVNRLRGKIHDIYKQDPFIAHSFNQINTFNTLMNEYMRMIEVPRIFEEWKKLREVFKIVKEGGEALKGAEKTLEKIMGWHLQRNSTSEKERKRYQKGDFKTKNMLYIKKAVDELKQAIRKLVTPPTTDFKAINRLYKEFYPRINLRLLDKEEKNPVTEINNLLEVIGALQQAWLEWFSDLRRYEIKELILGERPLTELTEPFGELAGEVSQYLETSKKPLAEARGGGDWFKSYKYYEKLLEKISELYPKIYEDAQELDKRQEELVGINPGYQKFLDTYYGTPNALMNSLPLVGSESLTLNNAEGYKKAFLVIATLAKELHKVAEVIINQDPIKSVPMPKALTIETAGNLPIEAIEQELETEEKRTDWSGIAETDFDASAYDDLDLEDEEIK